MSDTKEKDDVPHNLPVDTAAAGEERLAPDAAVPLVHQAEQPQTEEPLVEAGGDGSDPAMVKQDDPEGGNVAALEMDTKATAEADEKAGVDAETGGDEKVGAEAEKPGEAANGSIIGNGSVDNAGESAQEADTSEKQAEPQLSSGAESVVVPSVPNEKVAQNESAAVQSVPEGTVVKNDAAASETRVESVEPASDVVTPGAVETAQPAVDTKTDVLPVSEIKADARGDAVLAVPAVRKEHAVVYAQTPEVKAAGGELGEDIKNQVTATGEKLNTKEHGMIMSTPVHNGRSKHSFLLDDDDYGNVSGTEEEQVAFMKELENFFRGRSMDFKPPKFYGEGLNCLKLWRSVMRLGGYDKVTSCKLWRQVGESFRPPKTCTTVSWTFRGFYEKALLDYERHKVLGGEVTLPIASQSEPGIENQGSGSGRVRRDAASRAMQGWHSQRLLGNGEVSDPIIRDKTPVSSQKREKQLANIGLLKRKKPSYVDSDVKLPPTKASKTQLRNQLSFIILTSLDIAVVDIGLPADWVKINVQRTKDCFEVYALVPGLLREEVRVQSDPAGRLVISGEPEHPDNPWGVTPFKKVVSLPSRIDPHQTSAVVTLHGQLFVRVPFEPLE